jgi:hypothetical protein
VASLVSLLLRTYCLTPNGAAGESRRPDAPTASDPEAASVGASIEYGGQHIPTVKILTAGEILANLQLLVNDCWSRRPW